MIDVALAAYLGGAACYAGVLCSPSPTGRLPAWYVAVLALAWPACVALALAGEERHG